MTHDDPTRPDLDAAIDAVVPSLTVVSDQVAADSLRRTRAVLADAQGRAGWAFGWRWVVTAATTALLLFAAARMWQRPVAPDAPPALAARPATAIVALAPAPVPSATPLAATPGPAPSPTTPRGRTPPQAPVAATSTPLAEPVRRPDPLIAMVRAVQTIPEDAWTRGTATPASAVADVVIPPIAIAPLETPAITGRPVEPILPGEP